jgi:hypothetical protein
MANDQNLSVSMPFDAFCQFSNQHWLALRIAPLWNFHRPFGSFTASSHS